MTKYSRWLTTVWSSIPIYFFIGSWIFLSFETHAQSKKFVIYFKDKQGGNPYTISKPEQFLAARSIQRRKAQNIILDSTDLPVSPAYLNGLKERGATVLYPLKWVNGAIVEANPDLINAIQDLPFVSNTKALNSKVKDSPIRKTNKNGIQNINYGESITQNSMLGIDSMHAWGFHGENKLIAVLDAGFLNVNGHTAFAHIFQNNRLLGTRDLVERDGDVYNDHWHGAAVLSNIGGYMQGNLVGGAYESSYYLIRTEEVRVENEYECAYWVAGLELADSLGADILNSSLGYTTFDTRSLDYSITILDGNSTIASKSASMAARKGIVVLNSAGNEGENNSWGGWISAPADADSILTVGSVTSGQSHSGFSGKGPTADNRIKPDLVALGSGVVIANAFTNDKTTKENGTSFASPILCGMAAGFWQAHPELNAKQVIELLKKSGSNHESPNNKIGWGVPNFVRAHILAGSKPALRFPFEIQIYPNPSSGNMLYFELIESSAVGIAHFELTDLRGASILKDEIFFDLANQTKTIDLPFIAPGMYSIKLEMGGKQFLRKLLVQ